MNKEVKKAIKDISSIETRHDVKLIEGYILGLLEQLKHKTNKNY